MTSKRLFPFQQGLTACYECQPKPTQKVYPICTIRSTPDKPVHCVVWAKELFKLLFGTTSDSLLDEPLDGPDQSVSVRDRDTKKLSLVSFVACL